jgi:hypothetical protein
VEKVEIKKMVKEKTEKEIMVKAHFYYQDIQMEMVLMLNL